VRLEGTTRLVLDRAVATALYVAQRDAFDQVAVGTMRFRDLDEAGYGEFEFAVKYDLRDDADLARLHLHKACYVAGEPGVGVPILRVEATLRFDVWRLVTAEPTG
jgi:hypothetical protein